MLDDKYFVIGNLGGDPEVSKSGSNTTYFSLCINKFVNGEDTEKWIKCFISDKSKRLENVIPYLKKGQQVALEGEPFATHSTYNNKISSQLCLQVFDIKLLGSKKNPEYVEYIDTEQTGTPE